MSRKTILAVLGVLSAILTFIKGIFGLEIDVVSIVAGLGAVLTYVLLEAKLDLKRLATQPGKWADPKFWLTFISVLLASVDANFTLNLPVEAIISVLTVIVGIIFKVNFNQPEY